MKPNDVPSESKKKKEQCPHKEWARIWLASNNYRQQMYCRKCLKLKNSGNEPQGDTRD